MNKRTTQVIIGVIALVLIGWAVTVNLKKTEIPTVSEGQNTLLDSNGTAVATNLKVEILSGTSVMVSWVTDFPGTSEVYFSTVPLKVGDKQMEVKDPILNTKHTVELTHLVPSTKYYFSLVSTNPQNKTKAIIEGEFVTSKK